jgi:hypothetical protein
MMEIKKKKTFSNPLKLCIKYKICCIKYKICMKEFVMLQKTLQAFYSGWDYCGCMYMTFCALSKSISTPSMFSL